MARKKNPTPKPVVTQTVCSVCGLDWDRHGDEPTTEKCVELLKADLSKRTVWNPAPQPIYYPVYIPTVRPTTREVEWPRRWTFGETEGKLTEGGITKVISSGANVTINKEAP